MVRTSFTIFDGVCLWGFELADSDSRLHSQNTMVTDENGDDYNGCRSIHRNRDVPLIQRMNLATVTAGTIGISVLLGRHGMMRAISDKDDESDGSFGWRSFHLYRSDLIIESMVRVLCFGLQRLYEGILWWFSVCNTRNRFGQKSRDSMVIVMYVDSREWISGRNFAMELILLHLRYLRQVLIQLRFQDFHGFRHVIKGVQRPRLGGIGDCILSEMGLIKARVLLFGISP